MGDVEKYGKFIDEEGCFELTETPPKKWVNLHYNKIGDNEIYSEITNIGDGHTWTRDNEGNTCVLVNYDNKYLYIRDDESKKVFCPGGAPAPQEVSDFSCKYWAAKTEITGTCDDIKATQRVFVPAENVMEIWTLTLENKSERKRKISVFAYAMFQLTGCDNEGSGVWKDNYAEVVPEIGGVFVTNRNANVPTNRYKGYLVALKEFSAGNGYRDQFFRSDFSSSTPKILWDWNCDNKPGYGPDCAGIVQVTFEIDAKCKYRVDFLLGQAASKEEVSDLISKLSENRIDEMCANQIKAENERASKFIISTGYKNYDSIMNHFVKKQMYSYLINKSGFRDNLQNDCALSLIDYKTAEDNLLRALSAQMTNGKVIHGFRPINRLQYSDKPAWILMTVPMLIKESGDFSLLDKKVGYFESKEESTVWEHMLLTMRYMVKDIGVHGLSKQHHADWNDGLEATAQTGERESVMVTQQLCYGLIEMEEIANIIGQHNIAKEAKQYFEEFKQRLNNIAWDGDWYSRFLCQDGYKGGSHINEEGKIFINSQSWAVLSKTTIDDRGVKCMDNLEKYLKSSCGYKLVSPAFTKYDARIGRMSNSMYGHAENGGCYNHAAGFKAVADCMLGRAEEAWETFVKVAPDNPENPVSISETEPFSFTNMYSTCEFVYGKAGYPWRTGTAGWVTMLLVEWILGAKRGYEGLIIDPCLTSKISHANIKRHFRGAIYDISIDNSSGNCKKPKRIEVDGKEINGNVLPDFRQGIHNVKVIL